jgi:hypothetical protein
MGNIINRKKANEAFKVMVCPILSILGCNTFNFRFIPKPFNRIVAEGSIDAIMFEGKYDKVIRDELERRDYNIKVKNMQFDVHFTDPIQEGKF